MNRNIHMYSILVKIRSKDRTNLKQKPARSLFISLSNKKKTEKRQKKDREKTHRNRKKPPTPFRTSSH